LTNLIWFRADLRTADNTALYAACAKPADPVLAVFLLSPAQWLDHDCLEEVQHFRSQAPVVLVSIVGYLFEEMLRDVEHPDLVTRLFCFRHFGWF